MDETDIVVAFQLSTTALREEFRNFLEQYLEEDLNQVFHGDVTEDELKEIRKKAGSIEYEDERSSDHIVIFEHDTLGLEKSSY